MVIKKGSWWFSSKSDPRWKGSGNGYVGGFVMSTACEQKIEKLKKKYGEPPKDLEWGYMKD